MSPQTTRFAPSPTGRLHLGHAYSALVAWNLAHESRGRFLLRIEDIDPSRCREEFVDGIYEDLLWLGLAWPRPVRIQSQHRAESDAALEKLERLGLLYPCFCTRKDILRQIESAASAPHGPEGVIYPGTCRALPADEQERLREKNIPFALRLDVEKALEHTGPLLWQDLTNGRRDADPRSLGDVVLARKDIHTSYHLAVTVDDALQGITLVSRGTDLLHTTPLHRLLQALLDLPSPTYHHHPLLLDENGERLSKRDSSITLRSLRDSGASPQDVYDRIGIEPGSALDGTHPS